MKTHSVFVLLLALFAGCARTHDLVPRLSESDGVRLEAIATVAGAARFLCVGVVPDTTWQLSPGRPPEGLADASPALVRTIAQRGWSALPMSRCSGARPKASGLPPSCNYGIQGAAEQRDATDEGRAHTLSQRRAISYETRRTTT